MVGSLIRERRLAAGLSQERLAEVLGTTQRQITRWEGYSTQLPRDAARQQLGAVLGIAPHEWHLAIAEVEALRPAPRPRPPVPLPHFLADSLESLLARLGAEPYEDTDIVLDQVVSAGKGKGVTEEGARYRPRKEPLYDRAREVAPRHDRLAPGGRG